MAERRALIEGLDAITDADPELAADFVFSREPRPTAKTSTPTTKTAKPADIKVPNNPPVPRPVTPPSAPSPLTGIGRVPVGARIRTELATALKRASLERQLQGIEPHTLQDILEELIEPWLQQHGYLLGGQE